MSTMCIRAARFRGQPTSESRLVWSLCEIFCSVKDLRHKSKNLVSTQFSKAQ